MRRVFVFLVALSWYCIMIEAAPPSTTVVTATVLPAVCYMGSPSGSSTASDTEYIAVEGASKQGTPRAVTPVDKDAEWVIIARDHDDDPVFMARNAWHLSDAEEKYPDITFTATK